ETGASASVSGSVERYDPAMEELVYRCAQEALANVRKHASPSQIEVVVDDRDGWVRVAIADDGVGFDTEQIARRPSAALHMGIDAMMERVRAASGEISIESQPGAGTTVRWGVPA